MLSHVCKSKQIYVILLSLAASLFAFGCSKDSSETVGGGGAEFDPNLYYTKTQIDAGFAPIDVASKWVAPGGSLTGTITGIKTLYDTFTTYDTSGAKPDIWSSTANVVVLVVTNTDPVTKPLTSDVTIKGGTSESNSISYIFPAGFKGSQVYVFPRDVAGEFRVWASSWTTNTNGSTLSIYPIAFTSQF